MKTLIFSILVLFGPYGFSEELDSASQEALQKTQQLLTNMSQRQEAIVKDPKAKAPDSMAEQAVGFSGGAKEDVYQLASEVFADLVKQTNGDGKKMQEIISEFKRNPAGFAEKWTPEQKARLKTIADQIGPKDTKNH